MIEIDVNTQSYVCPFCGRSQAYLSHQYGMNMIEQDIGFSPNREPISPEYQESSFRIYTLKCSSKNCQKIAVTAINRTTGKQVDLVPQVTMKHYPNYIPEQIRHDYEEACGTLETSPKAAATLLRRCLQGMIHDFYNIHEKNLNAEITALKSKIVPELWKAIDGLRKIGNIGAHMERDVNLIIDIDTGEAKKLLKLIELLFDKWYIARHDEEELFNEITNISDDKTDKRNIKSSS